MTRRDQRRRRRREGVAELSKRDREKIYPRSRSHRLNNTVPN
jgi:hypothetical protein